MIKGIAGDKSFKEFSCYQLDPLCVFQTVDKLPNKNQTEL